MQRHSLYAGAVGGALAAAVALWMIGSGDSGTPAADGQVLPAPASFDRSLPLEQRIQALEQAVSDERYARQLLQDEMFVLTEELEALTSRPADVAVDAPASFERIDATPPGSRRQRGEAARIARLVEAGFPQSQAEWILERESQLQMEALQARYEAERSGDPASFFRSRAASNDALRAELGDADYERYLAASGRSTSVAISDILDSSPAERVGLRPGDEIVSYDGTRIFSISDLARQTLEGQPGEQVVVDLLRDGVPMQVVVPRGPIGISGGRRFSR